MYQSVNYGQVSKKLFLRTVLGLFLLSALLRFPALPFPDQVVFDEKYFGNLSSNYCCSGEYQIDLHPPHAKLFYALPAALFSDFKDTYSWPVNGLRPMADHKVPLVLMRSVSAFFGSLVAPCIFILGIFLGASYGAAILAALFQIFENAFILQSRLVLLDPILVAFVMLSLTCYVVARSISYSRKKLGLLVLSVVFAGIAFGCKFTGLMALGAVLVLILGWDHKRFFPGTGRWSRFHALHAVLTPFLVVYLLGWFLDYILVLNNYYEQPKGVYDKIIDFFARVAELHVRILERHGVMQWRDTQTSLPISWPMGGNPIYYWLGPNGHKNHFMPNEIVWVTGAVSSLICMVISFFKFIKYRAFDGKYFIPALAYGISYFPNFLITRSLYAYQYLAPASISLVCFAVVLTDGLSPLSGRKFYNFRILFIFLLTLLCFGRFISLLSETYPFTF